MNHLIPCPGCERHVRASEPICPFCAAALPMSLRRAAPPPAPPRRAGRAATFAFGAVIAAASTGCGQSHTPGADAGRDEDAGVDSGTIMAAYGAPPIDGSAPPPIDAGDAEDAGPTADAGPDGGQDAGFFPPYGTPPADGDHALV